VLSVIRLFWKVSKHKKSRARAIILNHDKTQILLVKNITYKQFHLPGGGIEKEESGEVAVIREIKEELGIDISVLYQLGRYKYNDTDKHVEIFVTQTNATDFQDAMGARSRLNGFHSTICLICVKTPNKP
jgi:8-oxo-dGTP pyrophosphatase MutT (NUDIX family)